MKIQLGGREGEDRRVVLRDRLPGRFLILDRTKME